jgi:2,4-dienoyl-CoA reductase-like NADH-dependent reductase (Old Yellow Enzyme family)
MASTYSHVFDPVTIGPISVRNRIYLSPHGNAMSWAVDGDYAAYLEERAADGGVGLVIQSLTVAPVLPTSVPYREENVPLYAAIADLLHGHDTKIFGQLHYWWGLNGGWDVTSPRIAHMGPSANQRFETYEVGRKMTADDIEGIVDAYARSAINLREAGYDGFEVHATHGMLAEQFLSPYFNRRDDEWGADSLENRMRLLVRLLRTVREVAGPERPVGVRFNCDEMLPGGVDQEAAREGLAYLQAEELIDFADLDVAVEPNQFPLGMPNYQVPKFSNESFAANVRKAAPGLPILCAIGRTTSVADAERAIAAGSTDLVGVVRGLMAEPRMIQNAAAGNEHLNRTCTGCNYCMDRTKLGFNCAINPATARERKWGVKSDWSAPTASRVVVVGGGPAGLEGARVAAMHGHEVTLLERGERLGGQYLEWTSLPGREGLMDAIDWYERILPDLGVEVRMGTEATRESVLAARPDAVLVATGAAYDPRGESGFIAQPIPGWDGDNVFLPEQILGGAGVRPTGRVVILDDEGFSTGVGIAEVLAEAGAEVEIVTRWLNVGHNTFNTFELPMIIPQLRHLGVRMSPQTYVKQVDGRRVTVFDIFTNREEVREDVEAVVLATRRLPRASLCEELEGEVGQLFPIGDALGSRDHGAAFYEGAYFARMIGQEGAPTSYREALYGVSYDFPGSAVDYLAGRGAATPA